MAEMATVQIEGLAFGGRGVARHEGLVVFVAGSAPGETVEVELHRHQRFAEGHMRRLLSAAPERRDPLCPLALRPGQAAACPGCAYQHLDYTAELAAKCEQLGQQLLRLGGGAPEQLLPALAAPEALGYRNKIVLHAAPGGAGLGYYGTDNRSVLDVPACPLARPELNARLAEWRARPGWLAGLPPARRWTGRWTAADGALAWEDEAPATAPPLTQATAIGPLAVPRAAFFQVNDGAAALLLAAVQAQLRAQPPEGFLDLYCGVGVFALAAARLGVPAVLGIELEGPAVAAARQNAAALAPGVGEFLGGDAGQLLPKALKRLRGRHPTLLVDPPRGGLAPAVLTAIAQQPPPRLLYVSCAADTLARDVARLRQTGYRVRSAQVVDMFPRTPHFESLTVLER